MKIKKAPQWTHPVVIAFTNTQPEHRLATLLEDVRGRDGFTRWKAGEVVKAHKVKGVRWFNIEKLKPKRLGKGACRWAPPLINQCCGIPKRILRFHDVKNGFEIRGRK